MSSTMNRRKWLKAGSMLTGGFTLFSGTLASLAASASPEQAPLEIITGPDFKDAIEPKLKARLFANENPFGPSPKAKQAIIDSIGSSYQYATRDMEAKYERIIADELKDKIMAYEDLPKEMIVITPGSSPVLQAAAIYFGREGSIITADPSYSDLVEQAEDNFKAKVVKVPLNAAYSVDLDAMEKAIDGTTKLIYICNPNNPTATIADIARLKDFCERVSKKVTVLIDEAYIDYLPDPRATTLIENVKKGQNIIVARTFSKLYGFAGLRVGYMIAQPEMVKKISPYCTGPFGVSNPAIRAAIVSYQDKEFLQEALKKTLVSKEFLYKTLKGEGYDYIPSSANFVMFPLKMEGNRFADEMMRRGVGIRFWKFNDKDWCRVSIGRMDEMEAFAAAFKELS